MIANKFRFHGHGSIRFVYTNGQAVRTRQLTLKWVANPRRRTSRIAVVVSKKTLKSAVGRNRIRRRIYESVRQRLDSMVSPTDLVFIVSAAELRDVSSEEVDGYVHQLLSEANLYKTP